jgi:hypothetical protein
MAAIGCFARRTWAFMCAVRRAHDTAGVEHARLCQPAATERSSMGQLPIVDLHVAYFLLILSLLVLVGR